MIAAYNRLQLQLDEYANRDVLAYDARADAYFQRLRKARVRVGTMDLRIASISLAHDATLITRNLKDFGKAPGLKVEDWTV